MADPLTPPVASAPAGPSQEDLVLQQFAAAKKKMTGQQQALQDQAAMDVNRRVAQGGLTGGAQTKVLEKSQQGIANQYAGSEADLEGQKNQSLQQIAATKQAQQFQTGEREAGQQFQQGMLGQQEQFATGERLGSQQFAGQQTAQAQNIQQQQFNQSYGLQQQQFNEAKRQFDNQMKFTYDEFDENQKTNLINAAIAIHESSIDSPQDMSAAISKMIQLVQYQGGGAQYRA